MMGCRQLNATKIYRRSRKSALAVGTIWRASLYQAPQSWRGVPFSAAACSVSVRVLVSCLQVLSNHAAAVSRRRADYLLHMHDLRLEVEAGFVAA